MVKALFDTNILIDYLVGIEAAKDIISRYENNAISIISWMELMVGIDDKDNNVVQSFLGQFEIIAIESDIATQAVLLRKKTNIKLPDAIIWATAITRNRLLITRNTKDFAKNEVGVIVPYQI